MKVGDMVSYNLQPYESVDQEFICMIITRKNNTLDDPAWHTKSKRGTEYLIYEKDLLLIKSKNIKPHLPKFLG